MVDRKTIVALAGVTLTDGTSAIDYLAREPKEWRHAEAKAIMACIHQGWPLHKANIQAMARELNEYR